MIPDEMRITFYKIQLRTAATLEGRSLLERDTGKEIVLINSGSDDAYTNVSVLDDDLSLGNDTYSYLYLEIGNRLGIKNVSEFIMTTLEDLPNFEVETTGNKDWSGRAVTYPDGKLKIPGKCLEDAHSPTTATTGYFYTRGQTTSLSDSSYNNVAHNVTVVNFENSDKTPAVNTSVPSNVEWDYEIIDNFSDYPEDTFSADSGDIIDPVGADITTAKLLQDDGVTPATSKNNASRIGMTVTFANPTIITPSTIKLDLSFRISDSLCAEFNRDGDNIIPIKFGANPFYVKVTTKQR